MSFRIVIADSFRRPAKRLRKKYVSLKSDFSDFLDALELEPLGRDCFKVRMRIAAKN